MKNCLQSRRLWLNSWVRKIPWRRDRLPTPVFLGFPCGSAGEESTCNAGDLGLIPGLGRSPGEGKGYPIQYSGLENSLSCTGEGNGNPLQCSCLENPRDGAAWWAAVYGVAESDTTEATAAAAATIRTLVLASRQIPATGSPEFWPHISIFYRFIKGDLSSQDHLNPEACLSGPSHEPQVEWHQPQDPSPAHQQTSTISRISWAP